MGDREHEGPEPGTRVDGWTVRSDLRASENGKSPPKRVHRLGRDPAPMLRHVPRGGVKSRRDSATSRRSRTPTFAERLHLGSPASARTATPPSSRLGDARLSLPAESRWWTRTYVNKRRWARANVERVRHCRRLTYRAERGGLHRGRMDQQLGAGLPRALPDVLVTGSMRTSASFIKGGDQCPSRPATCGNGCSISFRRRQSRGCRRSTRR